jgi:hypothetical protein
VREIETHRIVCTGPAPFAGLVVQTLRAEGLQVSAPPPDVEKWATKEGREEVTVSLIVTATNAVTRAAVAKVRERLRNRGTVDIEDDEGSPDGHGIRRVCQRRPVSGAALEPVGTDVPI